MKRQTSIQGYTKVKEHKTVEKLSYNGRDTTEKPQWNDKKPEKVVKKTSRRNKMENISNQTRQPMGEKYHRQWDQPC